MNISHILKIILSEI